MQLNSIKVKLNPVTKLRLFREVKKVAFSLMESGSMKPERGDEIFNYLDHYMPDINTPENSKQFYTHLSKTFPELKRLKEKFEMEEDEKVSRVLNTLVDMFMERGNVELANEIMTEIQGEEETMGRTIEKVIQNYPQDFETALIKIIDSSKTR